MLVWPQAAHYSAAVFCSKLLVIKVGNSSSHQSIAHLYNVNRLYFVSEITISFARGLAFVSRFGISASYTVIYTYTTELYPTVVRYVQRLSLIGHVLTSPFGANLYVHFRGLSLNMGSISANVGGTLVPYILLLQQWVSWSANLVFLLCIFFAAVLHLTLPETKSIKLLQTIEDAKTFFTDTKTAQFV